MIRRIIYNILYNALWIFRRLKYNLFVIKQSPMEETRRINARIKEVMKNRYMYRMFRYKRYNSKREEPNIRYKSILQNVKYFGTTKQPIRPPCLFSQRTQCRRVPCYLSGEIRARAGTRYYVYCHTTHRNTIATRVKRIRDSPYIIDNYPPRWINFFDWFILILVLISEISECRTDHVVSKAGITYVRQPK